jgi:ribosomal protein S18 acetylase RimI-like enzyme
VLLRARGYEQVRSYWRMVVDLDRTAAEAPEPPAGVAPRPLEPEPDAEALHAINERAFSALADYRSEPLERFAEEHLGAKTLDPGLSVVVEADGQPVGFALCRRWADEGRGYIDLLAVDPDAAGRGLGSWLLAASSPAAAPPVCARRCSASPATTRAPWRSTRAPDAIHFQVRQLRARAGRLTSAASALTLQPPS